MMRLLVDGISGSRAFARDDVESFARDDVESFARDDVESFARDDVGGFAMMEVIIAIGIIALVFLSLLTYQISVSKNIKSSDLQVIATLQLMNFSEMLRANQDASYREKALQQWNQDNARLLPHGRGNFFLQDKHDCRIVLKWEFRKKHREAIDVFC